MPKPRQLPRPGRAIRMLRCKCGVCQWCLEEKRWDKIFKEKFEDPDYYRGKTVLRRDSTLKPL